MLCRAGRLSMVLTEMHEDCTLSIKRAGAGLLALFFAASAVDTASAQEAPPKVIRLAGPGNAEGKPFGTGTLGVLKVKSVLEDEFKADGVSIQWQFPRGTGPAINEAFANGQLDFSSYGGLPNIVGRGPGCAPGCWRPTGSRPPIWWPATGPASNRSLISGEREFRHRAAPYCSCRSARSWNVRV